MIDVIVGSDVLDRIGKNVEDIQRAVRQNGIEDQRKSKTNDKRGDLDFYGQCGEVVFSLVTGLSPATPVDQKDFFDFILPNHRTVDIKFTKYDNGSLIIHTKDTSRLSDLYVLVTGEPPMFTVRGYITGTDLWDLGLRHHPKLKTLVRYANQRELRDIAEILDEI